MLELFKKNIAVVSILLLPYTILTRLYAIIEPISYQVKDYDSMMVKWIYGLMPDALVQSIVGIVLIYIQALLINRVGIKHQISKDMGLLPGLLFILIANMVPYNVSCHPILIGNLFLIFSLQYIFNTYNKKEVAAMVFMSAFYASIASMFYFPLIYFFFVTTLSLIILRSFSLQERLQHFIGWLIPYILLWSWQFFIQTENRVIPHYFEAKLQLFSFSLMVGLDQLVFGCLALLAILFFIINYGTLSGKKVITVQKKIDIFYWLLLYGAVISCIYRYTDINHAILFAMSLGYLLALSLSSLKNAIIAELVHVFMLGVLVFIHYF